MKLLAIIFLIFIFVFPTLLAILSLFNDRKANKDIEELRQVLDELQKIKSEPFDEETPPNVRIIILQQRLKKLVFCDVCPWYLTHSLKNTQTEFQEEIK